MSERASEPTDGSPTRRADEAQARNEVAHAREALEQVREDLAQAREDLEAGTARTNAVVRPAAPVRPPRPATAREEPSQPSPADAAKPQTPATDSETPATDSETATDSEAPGTDSETPGTDSEALDRKPARELASGIVKHRAIPVVRAWVRRPAGRLVLVTALMFAMLAVSGAAGVYVVPHTAPRPVAVHSPGQPLPASQDPDRSTDPNASDQDENGLDPSMDPNDPGPVEGDDPSLDPGGSLPDEPLVPGGPATPGGSTFPNPAGGVGGPTQPNRVVGRPADLLAGWAVPLAGRLGIPAVALQAYGYAALVTERTTPGCKLSWTTLAGIGKIESDHGREGGATLGADGRSTPSIVGLPLDGQGGRASIPDTDGGRIDGDRSWDRAVGPMQFIPSTWQRYAVDADNDGVADPNDIYDAALASATYLCANGRDLSTAAGWETAIRTYNDVNIYVKGVFDAANDYGVRSRQGA